MSQQKPQTVSKDFVNAIKKWVSVDDEIDKLKESMKALNKEKKISEKIILDELDVLNENVVEVTDGKLRKNITKTQKPLNKEHIKSRLQVFLKDDNKTNEILDDMLKTRPYSEKVKLKRSKKKESKILKNMLNNNIEI